MDRKSTLKGVLWSGGGMVPYLIIHCNDSTDNYGKNRLGYIANAIKEGRKWFIHLTFCHAKTVTQGTGRTEMCLLDLFKSIFPVDKAVEKSKKRRHKGV